MKLVLAFISVASIFVSLSSNAAQARCHRSDRITFNCAELQADGKLNESSAVTVYQILDSGKQNDDSKASVFLLAQGTGDVFSSAVEVDASQVRIHNVDKSTCSADLELGGKQMVCGFDDF